MNKEVFFGRNSIRFYYFRYKDSAYYTLSIIVVTIVVCILLIFNFILPQLDQWFSISNEVQATRDRIAIINDNIQYMNTVDRNLLNKKVSLTAAALPVEKDFSGILEALNVASLRAGVTFQDYSFQVGAVSSSSAQLDNAPIKGFSGITIVLVLDGTVENAVHFVQEVVKTLPISEVNVVEGTPGSITVTMLYYQRKYPQTSLKDDVPIPHVVESDQELVDQLTKWKLPVNSESTVGSSNASSSGVPLF